MVKTQDAIAAARALIGTPYTELDCINLIKKVIRTAPGGVKGYTTAGTNALWDSFFASAKYRDLTWRQESLSGAAAGMLAFKADGEDVHHVGLVTGEGTVVHSSSVLGQATETPLTQKEGWSLLAAHRYIETQAKEMQEEESMAMLYRAVVATQETALNVRQVPVNGKVIGTIDKGEVVDVYSTGEWPRVRYGDMMGYVSAQYLRRIEQTDTLEDIVVSGDITIVDGAGNEFKPVGGWRVIVGGAD